MKKTNLALIAIFSLTILNATALDFSYSNNGVDIGAQIERNGDYVNLNYIMKGLDTPEIQANMPPEAINGQQMSSMKMNMTMNCSQKTMKVNSMVMFDRNGNIITEMPGATGWQPITEEKDLQNLKNLCDQAK